MSALPSGFALDDEKRKRSGVAPPPEGFVLDEAPQSSVAPEQYEGWGDYLTDAARTAVGQGTLLGFGDELIAGARSLVGENYDEALKDERDAINRFSHHNPITSTGLTIAGGAVLPVGAAANAVRGAKTLAGGVWNAGKTGAKFGAVAGFGAGEGGLPERAQSALVGAGTGAAVGAAIPSAGSAARWAYGKAKGLAAPHVINRRQGPEAAADYVLAKRLRESGSSPREVANDLATGARSKRFHSNSEANLPEVLADTSDELQRLTGTVYRQGGEGAKIVRDALEGRQRGPANAMSPKPGEQPGQLSDIMDAVRRTLTIKSKGTALQNERAIIRDQKALGNKLYTLAYDKSEPFDIAPVVASFRDAASNYPKPFRARLERALRLFDDEALPINSIQRFDAAKKELDDMIEAAGRSGRGNLSRELTKLKHNLLDAVHVFDDAGNATRNQAYDTARKAWGSAAENREAINLGRRALRDDSEVTIETFNALSEGQQKLFRLGLIESARRALGTRRPGNDATLLFQQRRVQDLLRAVVPRSNKGEFADRPERLGEYLSRQSRMVDTHKKVLGGSPTQQRQMDDVRGAVDTLSSMMSGLRGGTNWALEAVVYGLNKVMGYNGKVSAALARRLVEMDPERQRQFLARLRASTGNQKFQAFNQALEQRYRQIAGTTGAALGNASGGSQ